MKKYILALCLCLFACISDFTLHVDVSSDAGISVDGGLADATPPSDAGTCAMPDATTTPRFMVVGDSNAIWRLESFPYHLSGDVQTFAVSGTRCRDMIARRTEWRTFIVGSGNRPVQAFIWCGHNNLLDGMSETLVATEIRDAVTALRVEGASLVIVTNLTDANSTTTIRQRESTFSNFMKANWQSATGADKFFDTAIETPSLGPWGSAGNPFLFLDQLHTSVTGAIMLAEGVNHFRGGL